MPKKNFRPGSLVIILALGAVLSGCNTPTGGGGDTGDGGIAGAGGGGGTNIGAGASIPAPPTDVTAAAISSSSISVGWNSVSGATSYKVYCSEGSSSSWYLIDIFTVTGCTHSNLAANTTYYYSIAAINDAGESSRSAVVSAKTYDSSSGGGDSTDIGNSNNDNGDDTKNKQLAVQPEDLLSAIPAAAIFRA
jgi:predicted small secreted protein